MRGLTMLLATTLTIGYGFAAQAAMSASLSRSPTPSATRPAPTAAEATTHIWYGGTLAPVTVEVSRTGTPVTRCSMI